MMECETCHDSNSAAIIRSTVRECTVKPKGYDGLAASCLTPRFFGDVESCPSLGQTRRELGGLHSVQEPPRANLIS